LVSNYWTSIYEICMKGPPHMTLDGAVDGFQRVLTFSETGRITLDPGSPVATTAQLPLTGAVMHSDAAVPGRVFVVDLEGADDGGADLDPRRWAWLSAVIGPAAHQQLQLHLRQQAPVDITEIGFIRGPSWDELWRLSLLLWLERWSWASLDSHLIDLEIGLVAARLDLPGVGQLAERRLLRAGPTLKGLGDQLESGGMAPTLAAVLTASVSAAAAYLDPGLVKRIVRTARTHTGEFVGGRQPMLMGRNYPAHWGGADSDTPTAWVSSVDWAQVPRGVLDPQDETVAVSYDRVSRSLKVEVLAAAGTEAYQWLRFRAVDPGSGGPSVADAPLSFDRSEGVYRGVGRLRRNLSEAGSARLAVDIYSSYSPLPPRVRPWQLSLLESQRHASRALVTLRLALAGPPDLAQEVLFDAHRQWELASASLEELAGQSNAEQVPHLDQLRAGCLQQRRACLQLLPGTADRVLSRLDKRIADLPAVPAPDLDATAGRPLLAEVELTHRSR
jgi:hypothetical protein